MFGRIRSPRSPSRCRQQRGGARSPVGVVGGDVAGRWSELERDAEKAVRDPASDPLQQPCSVRSSVLG